MPYTRSTFKGICCVSPKTFNPDKLIVEPAKMKGQEGKQVKTYPVKYQYDDNTVYPLKFSPFDVNNKAEAKAYAKYIYLRKINRAVYEGDNADSSKITMNCGFEWFHNGEKQQDEYFFAFMAKIRLHIIELLKPMIKGLRSTKVAPMFIELVLNEDGNPEDFDPENSFEMDLNLDMSLDDINERAEGKKLYTRAKINYYSKPNPQHPEWGVKKSPITYRGSLLPHTEWENLTDSYYVIPMFKIAEILVDAKTKVLSIRVEVENMSIKHSVERKSKSEYEDPLATGDDEDMDSVDPKLANLTSSIKNLAISQPSVSSTELDEDDGVGIDE